MTLETALEMNTAAIVAQTAMLEKIAAGALSGKAPTTSKSGKSGKSDKSGKSGKKPPQPWENEATFLEACTKFLKFSEDPEDRPALKNAVRPILEHFGARKFSEIDSEAWQECYGYIAKLQAAVDEDGIDGLDDVDLGLSNEDSEDDSMI